MLWISWGKFCGFKSANNVWWLLITQPVTSCPFFSNKEALKVFYGNEVAMNLKHQEVARNVLRIESAAINSAIETIDESFSSVVESILSKVPPGRVIVSGMGKSGHVGAKLAATLASTGTPAFFVHPAEAGHGDLGMISSGDVLIAISQSGASEEITAMLPYCKRNGVEVIAFTGAEDSPLAKFSNHVVSTKVSQEACPLGLAPTASSTLTLALGDALSIALLESRGFESRQFAERHPHGKLGRKLLLSVESVMQTRESISGLKSDALLRDVLFAMTTDGMGIAIVVDDNDIPSGVFTDGDLRRALDSEGDVMCTSVATVMTREFASISPSCLAVEAVSVMESRKVSALPVIAETGKLLGVVNMRQLLRAGVI